MLKDIYGHDHIKDTLRSLIHTPPRVMLFNGLRGVGKKHTAYNFIDEIYNLGSRVKNHPDVKCFVPENKVFTLNLVQEIQVWLASTPFELPKKYVIIGGVDKMNKEAANSCLKMLEDCDNASFILTSENTNLILDTILSRSILLDFYPITNLKDFFPLESELKLKLMGGCIGNKELLDDIDLESYYENVKGFLKTFKKNSFADILSWFKSVEDVDITLLIHLFHVTLLDLQKEGDFSLFLTKISDFKKKLHLSLNLKSHFKGMLMELRYVLE